MIIPTLRDVINFFFVFILIWWVVIFAVLPYGNAPSERKDMQPGQAASAPAKPRLKQKFILTSIIALLINIVVFSVIHYTGFQLFGPEKTL